MESIRKRCGILTALEVSSLDVSNAHAVMLSA